MCGRGGESVARGALARRRAEEEQRSDDEDAPEDRLQVVEVVDVRGAVGRVDHEVGTAHEEGRAEAHDDEREDAAAGGEGASAEEPGQLADAATRTRGRTDADAESRETEEDTDDAEGESVPEGVPVEQELGRVVVAQDRGLVLDEDHVAEPGESEDDTEHWV